MSNEYERRLGVQASNLLITPGDIGKEFICRDGSRVTITCHSRRESATYPVRAQLTTCRDERSDRTYTPRGVFNLHSAAGANDLIARVPVAGAAIAELAMEDREPRYESHPTGDGRFTVKDSGQRQQFDSGMVRDITAGKVDYHRAYDGVLLDRYCAHLTKGAVKYPDQLNGKPNWMLADGRAELNRFRASAARHFRQWLRGDTDEDHFSATVFNLNGYETINEKMNDLNNVA